MGRVTLKVKKKTIFFSAASNLAVDIVQLMIHVVYLMPCITANVSLI